MQMLQDAILPEELDTMRKILRPEMEQDEREHAAELGRRLAERRENAAEADGRNRHARRLSARLERLG